MPRDSKFTPDRQEAFLEGLRRGMRLSAAAEAVGVSWSTVRNYSKIYSDFKTRMDEAEAQACDVVENALFEKAKSGNITAIELWLFNRNKNRWADRRNIQVTTSMGTEMKSKEEIVSELKEILENTKQAKGYQALRVI